MAEITSSVKLLYAGDDHDVLKVGELREFIGSLSAADPDEVLTVRMENGGAFTIEGSVGE
ncbi:hypothetical protein [Brevibacterium sp. ZH18]|uniref:hypothetical protein n=1 Tax=Brevibacterium sp. ZH18 TaxID=2927784 RepID=UPI001F60B9CB|nr:hypothetical protein [Brevibacterium sp. ZH18]MCI4012354.1 hypothetical protein [Brevibacterium sp. ZH18]